MEKIVITSGKGGVGKTTVTLNLGLKLTKMGARVILVDMDFGLNNLDVTSKIEDKVTFTLLDVLNGTCRLKQALVPSPLGNELYVLPAPTSLLEAGASAQQIKTALDTVFKTYDYVLLDCPAGIDLGFHRAVSVADSALIVTTPQLTSLRDASKVVSILKSYRLKSVKVVVNRIRADLVLSGDMYSVEDIESTLCAEVCGVIPDQDDLLNGVCLNGSPSSKAFKVLAENVKSGESRKSDYLKNYRGFWGSIKRELKRRI